MTISLSCCPFWLYISHCVHLVLLKDPHHSMLLSTATNLINVSSQFDRIVIVRKNSRWTQKKSIYVDGDVVIPVNMSIQVLVTFMRQVVFYISIQHFWWRWWIQVCVPSTEYVKMLNKKQHIVVEYHYQTPSLSSVCLDVAHTIRSVHRLDDHLI